MEENSNQSDLKESKSIGKVISDSFKELAETFRAFVKAPKALWGINVPYIIEGLVYFGILTILGKFSSENLGVTDEQAGLIYSFVTGGITFAMLLLGGWSDKLGVRTSLALAFLMMLIGRIFISLSGTISLGTGIGSPMFYTMTAGFLIMIVSYGLFQPAAYAGVKRYTNKKTAAMGYAVIYGLMNLGAFFSGFISSFTRHSFENVFPPNGLTAVFWVYVVLTAVSLIITITLLTRKTDKDAVDRVEKENAASTETDENESTDDENDKNIPKEKINNVPVVAYSILTVVLFLLSGFGFKNAINRVFEFDLFGRNIHIDIAFVLFIVMFVFTAYEYIKKRPWHPFRDKRFTFFVFILIPVQTLFAHNWLTLPYYLDRAFQGSVVSQYFEVFTNLNPILIFILTPIIAGLTAKVNVYKMMIYGTFVMALPTFLLTIGPNMYMFLLYVLLMTIGEAMWSPRFLQWIAEVAPKGKVGLYMGVGQFPWFLDKVFTGFYSGWFLSKYIPKGVPPSQMHTGTLWFFYGLIAIITPISLLLARKWMLKGFKIKA
ncbi:major Facilitator Superfamily protein [bacterium BMS3Abin03]|nr:major Facilitator Superfamily protein [bacterium BMS3Abin03]